MYSKYEKGVRKQWKISMIGTYCFAFLLQIHELFDREPSIIFVHGVLMIIFIASLYCLFIWRDYHCAYKKNGTKWLTWMTIITPICILKEVLSVDINDLIIIAKSSVASGFVITIYSVGIWHWINTIRLLKINERIKKFPLDQRPDLLNESVEE